MCIRRVSGGTGWLALSSNRRGHAPFAMIFLCLLLMTGVCSCDLYKPQQEQKPAEQPTQQVKKLPLPQRGAQTPSESSAVPVDKKEATPAAAVAAKPDQSTAPVAPVAKPAPKPTETIKKASTPPSAEKMALPAHTGAKEQKAVAAKGELKGIPQVKKDQPPAADKKPLPVNGTPKTAAVIKKQDQKVKSAAVPEKQKTLPASTRNWTVVAGPYLLEETLANDLAKVKKAGITATVQQGSRRKSAMHRLFLAQFDDRAAAQGELDKLNKLTSDAFILEHGGKHTVYAGSYLLDSRAASEKERLAAAGFALTIKKADVAIPSKRLCAGIYHDKSAADAAAKKLKNAGIKDVLVHQ